MMYSFRENEEPVSVGMTPYAPFAPLNVESITSSSKKLPVPKPQTPDTYSRTNRCTGCPVAVVDGMVKEEDGHGPAGLEGAQRANANGCCAGLSTSRANNGLLLVLVTLTTGVPVIPTFQAPLCAAFTVPEIVVE